MSDGGVGEADMVRVGRFCLRVKVLWFESERVWVWVWVWVRVRVRQ